MAPSSRRNVSAIILVRVNISQRCEEVERTAQKLSKLLDIEYEGYEHIWQLDGNIVPSK